MTGYRNNPTANEEVFYEHEGLKYFRTGDVGKMVEGRFLKITGVSCHCSFIEQMMIVIMMSMITRWCVDTGRIKEQFKLENGKFVVPASLEDVYARSPFIAQIFITGMRELQCAV